jgi:hypothetical protein
MAMIVPQVPPPHLLSHPSRLASPAPSLSSYASPFFTESASLMLRLTTLHPLP